VPAAKPEKARRPAAPKLSARIPGHVTLQADRGGKIAACFAGGALVLGTFSARTAQRAQNLRTGLALASFTSDTGPLDEEVDLLVRRLAMLGLLEYRLERGAGNDEIAIEPQVADYWPAMPRLADDAVLVLSRFAYLRRRANEMVLESPRAGALFRIADPQVAAAVAALAQPQKIRQLRRRDDFVGLELLGLLVDCRILFTPGAADDDGARPSEGDPSLVLWDFHDLLFHARSTEGRHANPLGGVYSYAEIVPPLPAVRPRWPGKKIDLRKPPPAAPIAPLAVLLRERHSTRVFDDKSPLTLAELSRFLDATARVVETVGGALDTGEGPAEEYAARPYPSAGASYELELYLAVDRCEGLSRGFYHYDAGGHALIPLDVRPQDVASVMTESQLAMGAPAVPPILITIAARFGRMSWKYASLAYALILKDAGVLTQTFYLMATTMGLGGCAVGTANIDLFAKMTGIDFHVEGPVAQFALGRPSASNPSG
jgi:SagB-type dehydrogenase family enzyme